MATKKCSFCAEKIPEETIVCKHCGRDLEKPPGALPSSKKSNVPWVGVGVIGCLLSFVLFGGFCTFSGTPGPTDTGTTPSEGTPSTTTVPDQEEQLDEAQVNKAAYNAAIDDFRKLVNEAWGDVGLTRIEIESFRAVLYWNDLDWWVMSEEQQLDLVELALKAWVDFLREHALTHQSIVDTTKIEIRSLTNSETVFGESDGKSWEVKTYLVPNIKQDSIELWRTPRIKTP